MNFRNKNAAAIEVTEADETQAEKKTRKYVTRGWLATGVVKYGLIAIGLCTVAGAIAFRNHDNTPDTPSEES